MATGFFCEDTEPLPKSHVHAVGFPVELSLNCTTTGAQPESGAALKFATGWPFETIILPKRASRHANWLLYFIKLSKVLNWYICKL